MSQKNKNQKMSKYNYNYASTKKSARLKLQLMFLTEEILEKLLVHTNSKLYKNIDIENINATFK